jgi:hypothetical protein
MITYLLKKRNHLLPTPPVHLPIIKIPLLSPRIDHEINRAAPSQTSTCGYDNFPIRQLSPGSGFVESGRFRLRKDISEVNGGIDDEWIVACVDAGFEDED